MLIRCSDNCKFQEDGFCGLKNIYSASVTSSADEINDSGCLYYKPKTKTSKKQIPDNQKISDYINGASESSRPTQSNQERQKYF